MKVDRQYIEHYLYRKYKLMALNLFVWENLPDGLESRHIERALFNGGSAVMYKKNGGIVCFEAQQTHTPNVYNEPIDVTAIYMGGSETVKLKDKAVLILNNDESISTQWFIRYFVERMADIETSLQANIRQQKFPYLFKTNQKTLLSIKNIYNKIENDEPIIYADKMFDENDLQVFNTNVPFVADKLRAEKFELEREILTFFGLNNNYEKKERLVTDEVNSNNEFINNNLEIMFKCRKLACEEINKLFGLNVTVKKVNSDLNEVKEDQNNE